MEEIYGCAINCYESGNFINGIFIVGYLNERIEKFKSEENKPEFVDIRMPLSKSWCNTMQVMSVLRDYSENKNNREVEFFITRFFSNEGRVLLMLTGDLEVDFGSLSYSYDPDLGYDPDNDPYLHFKLKNWKLKNE